MKNQEVKLELIEWILSMNQQELLEQLIQFKQSINSKKVPATRKAGWGKSLVSHLAPDFADIPDGFEEYMP